MGNEKDVRKVISASLICLFLVLEMLGVTSCTGEKVKEGPSLPMAASIVGTYVGDMDSHYYIELEGNGKFSFRGRDKLYSGTWELEDNDGIILHFPSGFVSLPAVTLVGRE